MEETRKKQMEKEEEMFPVVKAYPRIDGVDGLMFWCPFCKRWHLHGEGEGHRVAHCSDETSPLYERGYVLKALTKTEMCFSIRVFVDLIFIQSFLSTWKPGSVLKRSERQTRKNFCDTLNRYQASNLRLARVLTFTTTWTLQQRFDSFKKSRLIFC